jgi:thiol-disulfide isomerase/thioredoxin
MSRYSKAAFSEALKNEVVVLDCFATWCGPCKVIAPKVVEYVFSSLTSHPLLSFFQS